MALPHEVGGGRMVRLPLRRSGIRARHCQACLTHTAITPPAGQSARSKAALRGNTAPDGVSRFIAHEPQTARRSRSLFNGPPSRLQQAAVHPLRRRAPVTSRYPRSEGVQCLRIGCTASSTTSLHMVFLASAAHAGAQQAQAAQRCTRYDSNALGRKALH